MKIGFIGLGNMAKAIIGGLLEKEIVTPKDLIGSAATQETCDKVSAMFEKNGERVETTLDNGYVAKVSDVLFLAVKPQFFGDVIPQVRENVGERTLVISIAAGKTLEFIENAFEKKIKLVRTMPNTPALVGEGCTGVCFNDQVEENDKELALKLLSSFGAAHVVPERLMDVVGAVSGSSPAYIFMLIEAMSDAAVLGGMPRKQAIEFAAQSVLGSAKLVLETGKHPGELKDMVCSPAGTTIEGVRVLEDNGFRGSVIEALKACIDKSRKL
ncbi:MAG: pyrroline-5-carboxylate reductase [Lachnospiraceae bacterium]|nr:pyrroline-5-carboxylate reductase [Candidatus Merdinaster equi]